MRFSLPLPTPQSKGLRLSRNPAEWPLALRFAALAVPVGICAALLALWLGYRASSTALHQSIESLPLLEAKHQAAIMGDILQRMRNSLSRIAQTPLVHESEVRKGLQLLFQEQADIIQEVVVRQEDGTGFFLLRDTSGFVSLSLYEAALGPNSPLQQIATAQVHQNKATLYPPVFFDEAVAPGHSPERRMPVMRMAMQLKDGSGVAVLGINVAGLRHAVASVIHPGSSLRVPLQEGAMQLSFFFDLRGWILFEMDNTGSDSFLPDIAREGYTGDLGRAGYDAAFRPWAMHENFWRMVTEVTDGRSGSIAAPADKYTAAHVGSSGTLCFAPVFFSPSADQPPQSVGGIAFFETSSLPLDAFLRLANYFLAVAVGTLLLFTVLALRLHFKVGRPLSRMADELESMSRSSTLDFLESESGCEEQERFKSAVNSLLAGAMCTRNEFEHLSREVHQRRSRQPVDLPRPDAARASAEADFGLLGSSALIREVREHVRKAARAGTDVLVWGETGTGKELVAAAIHKASSRSDGPYISLNCGALDENLLLDALFGHVKGAFTEARSDRKGAFLAADGGTLHLDEVANASLKVQQSLLRALSVRRIRVLGTDEEIPFNTRVVAATNVDLRECVRAGTFREDLYYRLAIISIETPPLRHRKEDIPELAAFCIRDAAAALGRQGASLSRGALELMAAHDWPGNVREFKNCLTRAMAFVEGDLILRQHITLEQDAYRTYAKAFPPEVLAEKIHPAGESRRAASAGGAAGRTAEAPSPMPAKGSAQGPDNGSADRMGNGRGQAGGGAWSSPPPFSQEGLANGDLPHNAYGRRATEAFDDGLSGPDRAGAEGDGPWSAPLYDEQPPFRERNASGRPPAAPLKNADLQATQGLNDRQLRALAFVHEHGELSRAEFESLAGSGISSRTAQNDLRDMVERGILKRVGAGPGTRYCPPR